MKTAEIEAISLAREALEHQRMKRVGSVSFNLAAEELRQYGCDALSAIEYVMHHDLQAGALADDRRSGRHLGIGALFATYFAVVKTHPKSDTRAAEFVASLEGYLVEDAIHGMWTSWVSIKSTADVPEALLSWASSVAGSTSRNAKFAEQFLGRYAQMHSG